MQSVSFESQNAGVSGAVISFQCYVSTKVFL